MIVAPPCLLHEWCFLWDAQNFTQQKPLIVVSSDLLCPLHSLVYGKMHAFTLAWITLFLCAFIRRCLKAVVRTVLFKHIRVKGALKKAQQIVFLRIFVKHLENREFVNLFFTMQLVPVTWHNDVGILLQGGNSGSIIEAVEKRPSCCELKAVVFAN